MGDHRASVKIQFEMHGIKRETDMWINWCPGSEGIDNRIIEFFEEAAQTAMDEFHEKMWLAGEAQRKAEREERERQEYARLKAKFEQPTKETHDL